MTSFDRIAAGYIETAGNTVSGLILDDIGESGHGLANKLWKVAAYLRNRNDGEGGVSEPAGDSPDSPPAGESRLPGEGYYLVTDDANADYAGGTWPVIPEVVSYQDRGGFVMWKRPDGSWCAERIPAVLEDSAP